MNIQTKQKSKLVYKAIKGAQWLNGSLLDSGPRGRGFEPQRRHCIVSLSKTHKS